MLNKIGIKKISALIVAFFLIATCFACLNFNYNNKIIAEDFFDIWNGTDGLDATTFSGDGDGTAENPYKITSSKQFAEVATLINKGINATSYYKLMVNIDLSSFSWSSIGYSTDHVFGGNFDGNNFIIKNYVPKDDVSLQYVGLFGRITNATIKNLTLISPAFARTYTNNYLYAGMLCGISENSNITNCHYSSTGILSVVGKKSISFGCIIGQLLGGTMSNCSVSKTEADISLTSSTANYVSRLGALCGYVANGAKITSSFINNDVLLKNFVNTSTQYIYLGGIVGQCDGATKSCEISKSFSMAQLQVASTLNSTNYIGGIVGEMTNSIVENCFYRDCHDIDLSQLDNETKFSYPTSSKNYIGGIVGKTTSNDASTVANQINCCYAEINFSGASFDTSKTGFIAGDVNDTSTDKKPIANCYYFNCNDNFHNNTTPYTNINVFNNATYNGTNKSITNNEAQNLSSFTNFDSAIWSNDINSAFTNNAYIILKGVNNDLLKNIARIVRTNQFYATLSEAFAATQDGDIVEIVVDSITTNTINVSKNITLVSKVDTKIIPDDTVSDFLFKIGAESTFVVGQNSPENKNILIDGTNKFTDSVLGCEKTKNNFGVFEANGSINLVSNLTIQGFFANNLISIYSNNNVINNAVIKNNELTNSIIISSGDLTVNNIDSQYNEISANLIDNKANLVVNAGNFANNTSTNSIIKNISNANINGGTFTKNSCNFVIDNQSTLTIYGGNFSNNTLTDSISLNTSADVKLSGYKYLFSSGENIKLSNNAKIILNEIDDLSNAQITNFGIYIDTYSANRIVVSASNDMTKYLTNNTFTLKNIEKDSSNNELYELLQNNEKTQLYLGAKTFSITYKDFNDNELAGYSLPASYTYGVGVDIPSISKDNYHFNGWHLGSTTGTITNNIDNKVSGNIVLYGQFVANEYAVNYYDMGSSDKIAYSGSAIENTDKKYIYGTGLTLPIVSKDGWTFVGWFNNYDEKVATKVESITTTDTGEKTFYAKWAINQYKLTVYAYSNSAKESNFANNDIGGTISVNSSQSSSLQNVNINFGETASLNAEAKEGYNFVGWYTNVDLSNSSFVSSSNIINSLAMTEIGLVYYAKFEVKIFNVRIDKVLIDRNGTSAPINISTEIIKFGDEKTVSFVVDANYHFSKMQVDVASKLTLSEYDMLKNEFTISNVVDNAIITIFVDLDKVKIEVNYTIGGTPTISSGDPSIDLINKKISIEIYYGSNITIIENADAGYRFDNAKSLIVSPNLTPSFSNGQFSINNIDSNVKIDITFIKTYIVKIKLNVINISGETKKLGTISVNNSNDSDVDFEQIIDAESAINILAKIKSEFSALYEFKNWTFVETGKEIDFSNSTNATINIARLESDIDIVANFGNKGFDFSIYVSGDSQNCAVSVDGTNIDGNSFVEYGVASNTSKKLKITLDSGSFTKNIVITTNAGKADETKKTLDSNEILTAVTDGFDIKIVGTVKVEIELNAYKFNVNLIGTNGTLQFDDKSTNAVFTMYNYLNVKIFGMPNEGYEYGNISNSYLNLQLSTVSVKQDGSFEVNFENLTLDKTKLDDKNQIKIDIKCEFTISTYTVSINNYQNGSVLINGNNFVAGGSEIINYGTKVVFTFNPQSSFNISTLKINDKLITLQGNTYQIDSLKENVKVEVNFNINQYNLQLSSEFNDIVFEINGIETKNANFVAGTTVTISVNLQNGQYILVGYYKNSFSEENFLSGDITYSFNITSNTNIFAKIQALVAIKQNENGSLTAILDSKKYTNNFYCDYGSEIEISTKANKGYKFKNFENDIGFGNDDNGTLTVSKPLYISAIFESKQVAVTLKTSVDKDGNSVVLSSIKHNGNDVLSTQKFIIGDNFTLHFEITNIAYVFDKFTGTFAGIIQQGEIINSSFDCYYTLTVDDAENELVEVFANFVLKKFDVNIICDEIGGKYSVLDETKNKYIVEYGTDIVLTIIPDKMYRFDFNNFVLTPDRPVSVSDNKITIQNITDNITVDIKFAPNTWWDYRAEKFEGDGTKDSPYMLKDAKDLALMSYVINNNVLNELGKQPYLSAYYQLQNNIDCGSDLFFVPIGTLENSFNGTFDFKYYRITSVITQKDVSNYLYGGLFDKIGEDGRVINQFKSYTLLILAIIGLVIIVIGAVIFVVFIEKKRRQPKKVFILPKNLGKTNSHIQNTTIIKPDLTKLNKK